MAPPTTPKTMSSRLLTMKFMQRAAASNPSSPAPSTPTSSESNKRRKTSHNDTEEQNVDTLVDQAAVRAALAEEEKKAEHAKLKRAEELGDAHWVLDMSQQPQLHTVQPLMKVVHVGFGQIDSTDVESETESTHVPHHSVPTIRRYNMDKKKKKVDENKSSKKSPGSDSDSDASSSPSASSFDSDSDDDSDGDDQTSGRQSFGSSNNSPSTQSSARKPPKGKMKTEQIKAMQFAERRRKKDVKLNTNPKGGISSISAGGGPSPQHSLNLTCFRCGRPGHKSSECKWPGKRQTR